MIEEAINVASQKLEAARSQASHIDRDYHAVELSRRELEVKREGLEERTLADLESVRRTGKRMQTERLDARASASLLLHPRVGVVVPKYRRNIIDRNRTRRRLRELARTRMIPILGRIDVLLRAKPEAYGASFDQLLVEVDAIAQWAAGIGSH